MAARRMGPTRLGPFRFLGLICALTSLLSLAAPTGAAAAPPSALPDFPVPNGHFYTQASGRGNDFGFSITDEGGANFESEFLRLGGVDQLGFPSSSRFVLGGFLTQATQKTLLQWRPDVGHTDFVNIFDLFTQRGLDSALTRTRLIPPTADNSADSRLSWPQVIARHLALLNQDPAIKARYFADPDPIDDFGLPQGSEDFGGVFVIRCQRAAFQQWRIDTSFARAGDVTQVNAGDLAKEFGLVPGSAATPSSAQGQLIAPLGQVLRAGGDTTAAATQSAARARPSLVRIDIVLPDGIGIASGIVIDRNGDILTNAHVVANAMLIKITFVDGSSVAAEVVGVDSADDLAVVRVPVSSIGSGVTSASLVAGGSLRPGQTLAAIGFTPFFPDPPATRIGVFEQETPSSPGIIRSDTYILPGDSGGMLLDLAGQVVGVNDEIRFTHEPDQPLITFSIDAADALRIAQRLLQGR
ncbi:MAG TPA: serine protease [Chloroflexota bacterium]|nr:serine protease [Chloroflexota bacterium]